MKITKDTILERIGANENYIRTVNHQIGSYEWNEVSLSCFDDKRYIHENGICIWAL